MDNLLFYIFLCIAIIIAIIVVKKVTGCIIKTLIFLLLVGALVAYYFLH